MNKKNLIIILVGLIMMLLVACGTGMLGSRSAPEPNEERIQNDLATNGLSPISSDRIIDSVEIIEYETDTEMGTHFALAKVFSHDNELSYTEFYRAHYTQNEEKEWILSRITSDNMSAWTISPFVGANEELVRELIIGSVFIIDDDEWLVDENTLESIIIISQDTNLEQNRDSIVATVEIKDAVLVATGQVQVDFRFDSAWQVSDYRVSTPFETTTLLHAVHDVASSDLAALLVGQTMLFSPNTTATINQDMLSQAVLGEIGSLLGIPFLSSLVGGGGDSTSQSINIFAHEISDFTTLQSTDTEKGTIRTYYGSFLLSKELANFEVLTEVVYYYDKINGWQLYELKFLPILQSINITETRWVGTFRNSMAYFQDFPFVLQIENINDDGSLNVFFEFPTQQLYGKLVGHIDNKTLFVAFDSAEWITEHIRFLENRIVFQGYLYIDELNMRGAGSLFPDTSGFNVTLDRDAQLITYYDGTNDLNGDNDDD
ncbi:MAG: hypothetical protein LBD23_19915 [Oscillospiraceae bacterium]|jgi:hypothetical protein|nr:hypothetical protein [Oscillospiraceae bacterium]